MADQSINFDTLLSNLDRDSFTYRLAVDAGLIKEGDENPCCIIGIDAEPSPGAFAGLPAWTVVALATSDGQPTNLGLDPASGLKVLGEIPESLR